jgi:hypothetical protein
VPDLIIPARFAKGDRVWVHRYTDGSTVEPCPDCLGLKIWWAVLPSGDWVVVDCSTCDKHYGPTGQKTTFKYVPFVEQLTIGAVGVEIHPRPEDGPIRYMCVETGIGSGSVYYERNVHATREEAMAAAELVVAQMNEHRDAHRRKEEAKVRRQKKRRHCKACGQKIYR